MWEVYKIVRLNSKAEIGGIILPRYHYADVRVYRSWSDGEKDVPVLLVPSVSHMEAELRANIERRKK